MTPAMIVTNLLIDNLDKLPGLTEGNICTYSIDNDNVDDTNLIIVVGESAAGDANYGNNDVISTHRRIQIQFYYPKDYQEDMALIEKTVKAFLRAHGYRCYADAGHIITPDTLNILNTLKFNSQESADTQSG